MHRVTRARVSCENCGKETERRITELARNKTGRFFCSEPCRRAVGGRPRRRADVVCEWCGKSFYPRNLGARFCSRACLNAWQGRGGVFADCEVCGTQFRRSPSHAGKFQEARWCGRACYDKARIKRPLDREHNGKPAVLDHYGYVRIYEPEHPRSTKAGWVHEHRLVVERILGRQLSPDEHVHHLNGTKDDNRPENLQVLSHGEHSTLTGKENGKRLKEWERYRERFGPLD